MHTLPFTETRKWGWTTLLNLKHLSQDGCWCTGSMMGLRCTGSMMKASMCILLPPLASLSVWDSAITWYPSGLQCTGIARSDPWDPLNGTFWLPTQTLSLKSDFLGSPPQPNGRTYSITPGSARVKRSKATTLYHNRSVFPGLITVCGQWNC